MEDSRFFLQNSLFPVVALAACLPSRFSFLSRVGYFEDAGSRLSLLGKNGRTMRKIGLGRRSSSRASLEACDTNEDATQCGHRGERLISFVRSPGLQTRRTKKLNESTTEFITARRRRNHSTFLGQSGLVEHRTRRHGNRSFADV